MKCIMDCDNCSHLYTQDIELITNSCPHCGYPNNVEVLVDLGLLR